MTDDELRAYVGQVLDVLLEPTPVHCRAVGAIIRASEANAGRSTPALGNTYLLSRPSEASD